MTATDGGGALSLRDLSASLTAGEPRILDLRLAEALGFDRPRDIRKLIDRSMPELAAHGGICATVAQNTDTRGRGRPGTEYWLNEGQALVLCLLSRTDRAIAIRTQVIQVFMAWRRGAEPPAPPPAPPPPSAPPPLPPRAQYAPPDLTLPAPTDLAFPYDQSARRTVAIQESGGLRRWRNQVNHQWAIIYAARSRLIQLGAMADPSMAEDDE